MLLFIIGDNYILLSVFINLKTPSLWVKPSLRDCLNTKILFSLINLKYFLVL